MKNFLGACVFVLSVLCFSTAQAHVLDGAQEWNGHYYKLIGMSMSWDKADKFCKSLGGHLATAETSDENEMIKNLVLKYDNNRGHNYWIGGYNKDSVWKWVTGRAIVDYFDWVGQPNSGEGYGILLYTSEDARWLSHKYSLTVEFVCEWDSREAAHDDSEN